jgi:hypothetical protein
VIVCGFTPPTETSDPKMFAESCRTLLTVACDASALPTSGVMGPLTTYSARTADRTASPIESCKPFPSTATNVTSARPIISADAVTAVRAGLRTLLSRASRPAAPATRAAGQARIHASGLTSRDEIAATPTKRTRQPIASRIRIHVTDRPFANVPYASMPAPRTISAPAM